MYNYRSAEKDWLKWKEAEEKELREQGADEALIQRLHEYDWKVFKQERKFMRRKVSFDECVNEKIENSSELRMTDVQAMMNNISSKELLNGLSCLDESSLQIVFCRISGYRNAEIAKLLGLSVSNVETKWWRAKNFLKNFLDKCEKRGDFGAYIVKDKIPSPDNSDLEN